MMVGDQKNIVYTNYTDQSPEIVHTNFIVVIIININEHKERLFGYRSVVHQQKHQKLLLSRSVSFIHPLAGTSCQTVMLVHQQWSSWQTARLNEVDNKAQNLGLSLAVVARSCVK